MFWRKARNYSNMFALLTGNFRQGKRARGSSKARMMNNKGKASG